MNRKFIWIILLNSFLFYSYAKPKNMKQIKENDIIILNQLGKDALSQKDLELAELYFRKSLSIENNYDANLQMANTKIQSWCTQDAKDFLLAAYKINATDDIIWYLSVYFSRYGSFDEAKNFYDKIIESSNDLFKLYITYGEMGCQYYYENKFELAEKYLSNSLKIYSENEDVIKSGYDSQFVRYVNSYSYIHYFSYYKDIFEKNKENKELFLKYNCKDLNDFNYILEKRLSFFREYKTRANWGNLISLLYNKDDAIPLQLDDVIMIPNDQLFIVIDRVRTDIGYYYLFTYSNWHKCYLVVSDRQIDLENVYSVGIRAKKDYYIKYIGNSSYQSQFQDVDCLMFRYYDYEPDNERLLELYDTIKLDD